MIAMTSCNYVLHKELRKPNDDSDELKEAVSSYLKNLFPDICIKCAGLILAITVYPPIMMYSVLTAAVFILTAQHVSRRKISEFNPGN